MTRVSRHSARSSAPSSATSRYDFGTPTDGFTVRKPSPFTVTRTLHGGSPGGASIPANIRSRFGSSPCVDSSTRFQQRLPSRSATFGFSYPDPDGGPAPWRAPVLQRCGDHRQLFYIPWYASVPSESAAHWKKFVEEVKRREAECLEILLYPGQVLIVCNHSVLHGRSALVPDSTRHHRRLWIASPQSADERLH